MNIQNAYDAWWFLMEHPAFKIPERIPAENGELKPEDAKYYRAIQDRNGHWSLESLYLFRHALESNLHIYYAKVDDTRTVSEDDSKNVNTECWLEFGPLEWGYHTPKWENGREYIISSHDIDLDCGAATFDEALTQLANLVLTKHGDYRTAQPVTP